MLLTYLLLGLGIAMFVAAAGILGHDAYLFLCAGRAGQQAQACATICPSPAVGWRIPAALVMLAWAPLLISAAIIIAPSESGSAHVSQTKETITGNL
jgi:hypothetical protein